MICPGVILLEEKYPIIIWSKDVAQIHTSKRIKKPTVY